MLNPALPRRLEDPLITAAVRSGADPYRVRLAALGGQVRDLEQLAGRAPVRPVPAGGFVLLGGDEGYPAALAAGSNPPPILFGLGDPTVASRPGVAVHGGLVASGAAETAATSAASAAAHVGAPVVCGAGAGAGLAAAASAIQFQTPVVFVLATGPDVPATAVAEHLAADVVAAGGVVLGEQPFGLDARDADAYRRRVADRHRLVAGLAAVLVAASGRLPSDAAQAVWALLELGRPVVVLRPATGEEDLQLPAALAHPTPPNVEALRRVGCPEELAARLSGVGPVANAVADDVDALADAVGLLWRLSPDVTGPAAVARGDRSA